MLFSYGVHTSEKGKNLKCFLLRCNLFVSVSFLPPVILVMIYEALYIKVLKHSSRLRVFMANRPGVYFLKIPQGGSIAPHWLVADLTNNSRGRCCTGGSEKATGEKEKMFIFNSFDVSK